METNIVLSDALKVKQFTEESKGIACPVTPTAMNEYEVRFIVRMILSELFELIQTVNDDPIKFMMECLNDTDLDKDYSRPSDETEIIAEQSDALVDAQYYMFNAAAKKGVNLSKIFNIVHEANMSKRLSDGKFHIRKDGKIEKPDNWKEPNIIDEIKRQMNEGAWN